MEIKCFLLEKTNNYQYDTYEMDGKTHPRNIPLWRRLDTGEEFTLSDAPAGAIWRAEWFEDSPHYCGIDGKCYVVKTPHGGTWIIDSRASNCTLPDDDIHKCWCRHGEAPNFTVDKNGVTCTAGAGSIITGRVENGTFYHGFLINGYLID